MKKTQLDLLFKPVMKVMMLHVAIIVAGSGIVFSQGVKHPIYSTGGATDRPGRAPQDVEALKKSVEPLMKMSIKEVIDQVPTASGIYFVGCPNCDAGEQEQDVLGWELGMGDKVRCNYCGMVFPNEKFPNNRETVIIAPSGVKQVYRYYLSPGGREYHYEPHAWYERWTWINSMAAQLARAWYATKDNAYGDRAAAIAGRFAQVFPDYAIRYDYPYAPVKFFPANQKWPYAGLSPYRGAKWRWWGFDDIPPELTTVYDILQSGYDWKRMDSAIGPGTDKRIARDLLRLGYEFVTANPEDYGNKSPGMYSQMIRVGRVLEDPTMVHEAVKRFREFLAKRFFADGWWLEGTPGYHSMTMSGLRAVTNALTGYTDPPDWKGERFENLDIASGAPLYQKALNINTDARLPDGRPIPINDTGWGSPRGGDRAGAKTAHTVSRLWPSLGDAVLGTGEGENQILLNLNWSGNYGHSHYDNGSIILYAAGQELLPDIGYTHGRYRGYTLSTASHNTVVIDEKDQDMDKEVTGQLKFYDDKDSHVKAIDLDASPAYKNVAKTYRRRLVMVNVAPGRDYIVDRFDVEGGKDHDWILHGMCEQEGTLETSIALDRSVESLVPAWGGKEIAKSQFDKDPKRFHPYSYMRNVKAGAPSEKPWTATWRYDGGIGLRTYNFSPAGTQVFRFRAPSIRPANDDDNKLENFFNTGIIQRNSEKISSFVTVHEPFRNAPWIESVQRDGEALVVRYKLNGAPVEDRVTLKDGEVIVSSSAGWKYNSGTAHSGVIEALETVNGKYRLRLDRDAPKVNYVRLDLSNGETRYYPVAAVQGKWMELVDDPGFTIGADGKMQFHTFPQDQHAGPLRYTLFVSAL